MYTQPQLEIYADDVKCSHGATVGQLDDNALFYMRQRGIAEREARLLLMFAFVNEVIERYVSTHSRTACTCSWRNASAASSTSARGAPCASETPLKH